MDFYHWLHLWEICWLFGSYVSFIFSFKVFLLIQYWPRIKKCGFGLNLRIERVPLSKVGKLFLKGRKPLLSFFHILSVLSVYVKLFFRDLESLSESSTKMRLVPFLNGNVINLLSLDYVKTYEKFSTFPQLFHLFLWREKLGFSELSNPLQRHDDIVAFMGFQTIECSCQ